MGWPRWSLRWTSLTVPNPAAPVNPLPFWWQWAIGEHEVGAAQKLHSPAHSKPWRFFTAGDSVDLRSRVSGMPWAPGSTATFNGQRHSDHACLALSPLSGDSVPLSVSPVRQEVLCKCRVSCANSFVSVTKSSHIHRLLRILCASATVAIDLWLL